MENEQDSQSAVINPDELFDLATPLLAGVPRESWPEIIARGTHETMKAGEPVYQQDEPGGDLLVLLSGAVVVGVSARAGEIHLAELGPGAVLGEMSFLLGGNRSASVRTVAPSTFLRFTNDAFQELLSTRSPAAFQMLYNVARSVAGRLKATDSLVRELSLRPEEPDPDLILVRRAIFTDPE